MTGKRQQTVLLGVTGGIAAYKACEIVRGLQKAGIRVKVVMTEHATEFVTPLTFRALTHEPVAVGLFDNPEDPIHHISLADECDLFLIAPATTNVIAKIANGISDDLLTTTAAATTAPLVICPAANVHMYENPANMKNMGDLANRGVTFIEADAGYLACGYTGRGRLADVDEIVSRTVSMLGIEGDMKGIHLMITAGPTIEPIDPVRYITNYSSGKTGYLLADAAHARGADVTLISGPVSKKAPAGVKVISVCTAQEMFEAAQDVFPGCDAAIFSAAVADLRPATVSDRKLKKGIDDAALSCIELAQNPDILRSLAEHKTDQFVVGFAAETNDIIGNARHKLESKHADMIVANEVGQGRAFGTDDNEVWLVTSEAERHISMRPKSEIVQHILDEVVAACKGKLTLSQERD